jgi:hypothetical protein
MMMKPTILQFYVARLPVNGQVMVLTAKKATLFKPSPGLLQFGTTTAGLLHQLGQGLRAPRSFILAPTSPQLVRLVFDMLTPNRRGLKSLGVMLKVLA